MGFFKKIISDAVDNVTRDAKYEARRLGRRTIGKALDKGKARVAKIVKPQVDKWVENHRAKKHAEDVEEVNTAIEQVGEEMLEEIANKEVAEVEVVGAPVEVEEPVRRLELD